MARDVRESAAAKVRVLPVVCERRVRDCGEVLGDGGVLVRRPAEVAAEAARRAVPCDLGRDGDGAADGGEVRAGGGEDGVELDGLVVWCQAPGADAQIAGGLDDCDASKTELTDQVAGEDCVVIRDRLYVFVSHILPLCLEF